MRRHHLTIRALIVLIGGAVEYGFAAETAKHQLERMYLSSTLRDRSKKTILVCLSDQIPATVMPRDLMNALTVVGHNATIEIENGTITTVKGDIHSYFKKGELLWIGYRKIADDYVRLNVYSINPHSVARGKGAFQHESAEMIFADIRFKFSKSLLRGNEVGPIQQQIEKWFKAFNDYDSAVVFGNTHSGIFVREVKIGMTVSEVEKILGPPENKFTFPDRFVYKYKDFTVEFKGNIVTDVKF